MTRTERIHQAEADALGILRLRYAGTRPTRDYCNRVGLPFRRWHRAIALLRLAGVFVEAEQYKLRTKTIVRYDVRAGLERGNAEAMVSGRARGLLARPDGYTLLLSRSGRG